jgi:hypothetical protein
MLRVARQLGESLLAVGTRLDVTGGTPKQLGILIAVQQHV